MQSGRTEYWGLFNHEQLPFRKNDAGQWYLSIHYEGKLQGIISNYPSPFSHKWYVSLLFPPVAAKIFCQFIGRV